MKAGPFFLVLAMVFSMSAVAQEQRRQPNTQGPSALDSHAARMEHDAAEDLKAGNPSKGWFVDIDAVYPTDATEYQAVGKNVLMVFSLFSDDRAELPLAKVEADGVPLQCLESIPRDVPPNSASAKALGKFRSDTLCTFPAALARDNKEIKIDFTRNHKGLQVSDYPFEEPDFVKADHDPRSTPKANPVVLQGFIDREYPGFGFKVRP